MEARFLLSLALGAVLHVMVAGVLCGAVAPSDPADSFSPVHTLGEEDVLVLRCWTDPLSDGTPTRTRAPRGSQLGKSRKHLMREQGPLPSVREFKCHIARTVR